MATKKFPITCAEVKAPMTCAEVRALLHCSSTSVARYVRAGHFTAIEINARRFLYDRDGVERFLATRPLRTVKPSGRSDIHVRDISSYKQFQASLPARSGHGA
jgi:hypothetical protein